MASSAIPRPAETRGNGTIWSFEHASMPTFAKGDRVKFGAGSDYLLAPVAGADEDSFGYVWQQNKNVVDVLLDGNAIVIVKVAAGGTATRGKFAVMSAANQYIDATVTGGGNNQQIIAGRFMNSGTDGDYVGLMVGGVNTATVKA